MPCSSDAEVASAACASASAAELSAAATCVPAVAAAIIPRLACAAMSITRTIRIPTRLQTTSRNESWPGASIWLSALRRTAISLPTTYCAALLSPHHVNAAAVQGGLQVHKLPLRARRDFGL